VTLYRGDSRAFQTLQPWQREQALKKGLIMVTETRTVALPAGRHTLRFDAVADGLIPQSAAVEGLPGGMVERNYDYALLSPGTLLERSLNQPVGIVRTNSRTGRQTAESAIVRQGPNGVVLQTATGVEALGCSGGAERLVFDHVPDGLSDKPALSTVVDIPVAATAKLTLSYLAIGVNWQADYVARIRPDGKTLDLTGWLTLVNSGSTSFVDAPTQAVAGKLSRVPVNIPTAETKAIQRACWPMDTTTHGRSPEPPPPAPPYPPPLPIPQAMAMAAPMREDITVTANRAKMAEQSDLGDYKLYTLPEPVTVAARQTKQVAFLDQKGVAFQRLYMVTVDPWGDPGEDNPAATVLLRLENKTSEGLGKPLPSGALAVMETTGGRPAFAGEQAMRDVPVGQPFDLAIGQAMDVSVRPRLVEETKATATAKRTRRTYEVALANAKSGPITIEVRHPRYQSGFKVISEPKRHDIRDGAAAWRFTLSPNSRETVRYVVEYDG
jgi:hypothetical protein